MCMVNCPRTGTFLLLGSAIFVRNGLTVDNAYVSDNDNIEVLYIELMGIYVRSVNKPPIETFSLPNAVTWPC